MVKRRTRFAVWWHKTGMGLRIFFLILGISALVLLLIWQRPEDESRAGTTLLVYLLFNLNIVLLGVLAFLIGRNVVKLIFDRRRGILGSQLRTRLVVAFVGLTLVPTTILAVISSGLLTRAMEGWFSSQVESSVNGAIEVARYHYNSLKDYAGDLGERIAQEIGVRPQLLKDQSAIHDLLENERKHWGAFSMTIFGADGKSIAGAQNAAAVIENFSEPKPDQDAMDKALKREAEVLFEERESSQFVRSYNPLKINGQRYVLLTTIRVSPELSQALQNVKDSYRDYEQLKFFKQPLKSNYILTLSLITALLLFSAVWIAFYIARELSVPIQRLAEATRHIARGQYDFQIREKGLDEMGLLVRSFNQMTSEIRKSRKESEQHRIYLETLLANLAVGVIGIDTKRIVASVNEAAARIFALPKDHRVIGSQISDVLRPEDYKQIEPLLTALQDGSDEYQQTVLLSERQIAVSQQGRELKILCTAGQISSDRGERSGFVLLFDDITELSKAQHMAAWRDVAQRIAHEIKNPLTPIQLSAQRLVKLSQEQHTVEVEEKIKESAATIVENVDSIKRLANEFSHFARMPRADFAPGDLNRLISDTIAPFAESHSDIVFQFVPDSNLPEVRMDTEQVRRIIMNLIDNAVAALKSDSREAKRIVVKSRYDRRRRTASFEIADTGPGIKESDKTRVFEPYFTTKKGGTGLGLAIVTSIVSDHQGEIRLYDNQPHGAKFVVDLPLSPAQTTQRRFVAA